jgi:hypothetical protein
MLQPIFNITQFSSQLQKTAHTSGQSFASVLSTSVHKSPFSSVGSTPVITIIKSLLLHGGPPETLPTPIPDLLHGGPPEIRAARDGIIHYDDAKSMFKIYTQRQQFESIDINKYF